MMATFGDCCISRAASMKQSSGTLVSESTSRMISPLPVSNFVIIAKGDSHPNIPSSPRLAVTLLDRFSKSNFV